MALLSSSSSAIEGVRRRACSWYVIRIVISIFHLTILSGPAYAVQAQRRGLQFEKSRWHDAGKMSIDDIETRKRMRWNAMTVREKVGDWAFRNQYRLIMASWAVGMGVASAIIFREKSVSLQNIFATT